MSRRDLFAVSVLSLYILFASILHLFDYPGLTWLPEMSERLAQLRKTAESLKKLGVAGEEIGYLSDSAVNRESAPENFYYYGLQYQFLPSVLVQSPTPPMVLCHLDDRANLAGTLEKNHLAVNADLGNGFFALKHEAH